MPNLKALRPIFYTSTSILMFDEVKVSLQKITTISMGHLNFEGIGTGIQKLRNALS